MYKINDPRLVLADTVLWLVDYDAQTGLVTSFSPNENSAKTFSTEAARNSAIYLINNNPNNSFIGHVPRPK